MILSMRLILIFSYIIYIVSHSAFASTLYVDEQEEYAVSPYLTYYSDVSGNLGLEEIRKKHFLISESKNLIFPLSSDAHWLRFELENDSNSIKSYYLEYKDSYLHNISFFLLEQSNLIASYETGASKPYKSRAVNYHKYLFPILLQPSEKKIVYLRLQNFSTSIQTNFTLKEPSPRDIPASS